jgi:hypothetical protein
MNFYCLIMDRQRVGDSYFTQFIREFRLTWRMIVMRTQAS